MKSDNWGHRRGKTPKTGKQSSSWNELLGAYLWKQFLIHSLSLLAERVRMGCRGKKKKSAKPFVSVVFGSFVQIVGRLLIIPEPPRGTPSDNTTGWIPCVFSQHHCPPLATRSPQFPNYSSPTFTTPPLRLSVSDTACHFPRSVTLLVPC